MKRIALVLVGILLVFSNISFGQVAIGRISAMTKVDTPLWRLAELAVKNSSQEYLDKIVIPENTILLKQGKISLKYFAGKKQYVVAAGTVVFFPKPKESQVVSIIYDDPSPAKENRPVQNVGIPVSQPTFYWINFIPVYVWVLLTMLFTAMLFTITHKGIKTTVGMGNQFEINIDAQEIALLVDQLQKMPGYYKIYGVVEFSIIDNNAELKKE